MSGTLLSVRDLQVTFDIPVPGSWPWTPARKLHAVNGVNFELKEGECLGVVGESGSGKSTAARAVIGLAPISGGSVHFNGQDLSKLSPVERRRFGKDIQMVFQDPLAALNPRMTVGDIIAEPLVTHEPKASKREVRQRVQEMMERVGLLPNLANRYPHEFSGGQCQRIGIARALILKPRLLICDEPVSALDVSVQAQVVNLLKELQSELGLSMIFIAHDLSVVKHISDRITVMYLGRLMEEATAKELVANPSHPYTQALISAVPVPDPKIEKQRKRMVIEGELPSPLAPPSGCVFRTRCPIAVDACAAEVPSRLQLSESHSVACPRTEFIEVLTDAKV